jgi:hypothetical protein
MRTTFQYILLPNAFQHTNVVGELNKSYLANIQNNEVQVSAECKHDGTWNPAECNVTIISTIQHNDLR